MAEMSVQADVNTDAGTTRRAQARARWLVLAHVAWIVCAVVALLVLLASIPLGYVSLLSGGGFHEPIDAPAWYVAIMNFAQGAVSLLAALVSLALAGIIFWKKRQDPGALFVSFYLLAHGIIIAGPLETLNGFPLLFPGAPTRSGLLMSTDMILGLHAALFIPTLLLFYLFPNGRFVPHWTRYVALLLLLMAPLFIRVSAVEWIPATTPLAGFTFAAYAALLCAGIYAQIYRYRRVAGPIERQQTKWVVLGLLLTVLIVAVSQIPYVIAAQIPAGMAQPWWEPFTRLIWWLAMSIMPLSLTLAVMRYRLWDIDIIINRALVYGTLSAGIVVTYILLVGLLGTLLHTNVNLAAALVTIALSAFLFRPLRTGVQRRVDRVIYGRLDPANVTGADESRKDSPTSPYGRLAWAIAWLSLILVGIGFAVCLFALVNGDASQRPAPHLFFSPVLTLAFSLVGALVASHHPRNPIGWIFIAVGFLSALNLDAPAYRTLSQSAPFQGKLPGIEVAHWLDLWLWMPLILIPFTFLLLLFPHGHLPSPRWRPIAWAAALGLAGMISAVAFNPTPNVGPNSEINPFGIMGVAAELELLQNIAAILLVVGIVGSVAALVVRLWRSRGIEREQIKWLVYAVILGILITVVASILSSIWPDDSTSYELSIISVVVALACIIVAAGIAILRYRLYDIDIILNRALVYGALTVGIVALYVLLVGAFSTLLNTSGNLLISLLATGLIAVLFQPLRERLQRGANRLMYGERDEPYQVLSRLGQRLEATLASDAVLPTVVETVAQALKLPYAAIELESNEQRVLSAEYGDAHLAQASALTRWPLVYQNEIIGTLLLAPRAPGESFSDADLRLLNDFARQAGIAAHAVRLTADLQKSREQLVTAREEERRRIRRDLHDGLGPALASLAMQADSAREWTRSDPDRIEAALADVTAKAQAALQDIRRLVYDLRPPALDELGLVGALRQTAASAPDGLHIEVNAPDSLPPLSAAAEVAAYRIAQEALNNVTHHARARNCTVQFSVQNELRLEISDDGVGLGPGARAGVGLISMRERAAELGGSCVVESRSDGGTRVLARLPLSTV